MIETSVERTGRVGVIVPHGVLFRSGAEGEIRKRLIEENLLEAVMGCLQISFRRRNIGEKELGTVRLELSRHLSELTRYM